MKPVKALLYASMRCHLTQQGDGPQNMLHFEVIEEAKFSPKMVIGPTVIGPKSKIRILILEIFELFLEYSEKIF
jgi:hypothetical protein